MNKKPTKLGRVTCIVTVVTIAMLGGRSSPAAEDTVAAEYARPLVPDVAAVVDRSGVQGGLVVVLAPHGPVATAPPRLGDRYLVQTLVFDETRVLATRVAQLRAGSAGKTTVRAWSGGRLPYADGTVNLVIVGRDLPGESRAADSSGPGAVPSREELQRVLAPGGVAMIGQEDGSEVAGLGQDWAETSNVEVDDRLWTRLEKRWPPDIDEWTHFLHGPDNNAVAEDTRIEPVRHLQWQAPPRWARSHDHLAGFSAAVSAAGRVFYIIDDGPIASIQEPAEWKLVARDAFSGVLLWKRDIEPWEDQFRPFRSGPAELPRRLVVVGDRVYVTPGYGRPVVALDAATGEVVRTFEGTDNTHEILASGGRLYLVASRPLKQETGTTGAIIRRMELWRDAYGEYVTRYEPKRIECRDATTGELLWQKDDAETVDVLPLTLTVAEGKVYYHNDRQIVALDAATGRPVWTTDRPIAMHRYAWLAPTMVVKDGVLLCADRAADRPVDTENDDLSRLEWRVSSNHILEPGKLMAFSSTNGEKLWEADCHEGFNSPVDVFVTGGRVYSGNLAWKRDPGITNVYDLQTGEVVDVRPADQECYTIGFGHSRCYRHKATSRYVLHGRAGVEFVDLGSHDVTADHWIRGACQYGILPSNGLLYIPPHSCACYIRAKLNSFNCLAPPRRASGDPRDEKPLFRGPAYATAEAGGDPGAEKPTDWPTYRHDPARSGATSAAIGSRVALSWKHSLPGPLSGVVVAGGRVYVAQKNAHTLHALSSSSGDPAWAFVAGGRIDSPPTVANGLVYFGAADGCVYCLRADGSLAWRLRAAPSGEQLVSFEQLESVWPVHGNVLVAPGQGAGDPPVVYCVAGRSSFIDGGLHLLKIDARTGKILARKVISHRDPATGREPQETVRGVSMPGALPDIPSTDGESIFVRQSRFDRDGNALPEDVDHLYSPAGFLDDSWWHRTYWQIGTQMGTGYGGWPKVGNQQISGRLLVVDRESVYGFGRKAYAITGSHLGMRGQYELFAAAKRRPGGPKGVDYRWQTDVPFYIRAMVLSGDVLFAAGTRDVAAFASPLRPRSPEDAPRLWAISTIDGTRLDEVALEAAPVFDSMAATAEGLFFTTVDGNVVCYGAEP